MTAVATKTIEITAKEVPSLKAIDDAIIEKSAKIQEHLKPVEGVIPSIISEQAFFETLPDDVTPELIAKVDKAKSDFFVASEHAVGSVYSHAFLKDKELASGNAEFSMGQKNTFSVNVQREVQYPDLAARKAGDADAVITKHLVIDSKLTTYGTKNAGAIKNAHAHLANDFLAALNNGKL